MKKFLLGLLLFSFVASVAQTGSDTRFSIHTDVAVMRNFSPKQKFWAFGQTVGANFHLNQKETLYAIINYYIAGKFENSFLATAKNSTTSPSLLVYKVTGKWNSNEVSFGWKHYFKGSFDAETGWNLYGMAGFGLMFVKADNQFDQIIDTSQYNIPPMPVEGINKFKRLTLDLGMGIERPLGGNIYLYGDLRTWRPMSNYPSEFLHNTEKVPQAFIISGGIRVLFGFY